MPKNELQKIFDNTPVKSYREKIKYIEDYIVSIADGVNIVGNGKELVYPDFWEYKHSFAEGIYIREMTMKKGQIVFSAIHKHSYPFFLLSGSLAISSENGVEVFLAPHYVVTPEGTKRVGYAIEDSIVVTVHANPSNTEDLKEIEKMNVVFEWEEYEEYLKSKNEKGN